MAMEDSHTADGETSIPLVHAFSLSPKQTHPILITDLKCKTDLTFCDLPLSTDHQAEDHFTHFTMKA